MLVCISGLPGHGKTLFALQHVEQLRKESGRPVYQHGIKELSLPWHHLEDPRKWQVVPDGSIVVVDEAWEHFPKRSAGSAVPSYVQGLAVHRHRGLDIFLVTQHPSNQLDHFVRGLVGRHYHVRRIFGASRSRLYTWERLGDYLQWQDRKEAVVSWFKFPPEVFTWYKSAEVHTVKRQIPAKPFLMMGGGVAAIALLGWFGWHQVSSSVPRAENAALEASSALDPVQAVSRPRAIDAASFVPSVPGFPFTAPFYESSVKVTEPPVIAGCGVLRVGHSVTCRCNDQQGNEVPMDHRQCLATFKAGVFQPGQTSRYPVIPPYVPPLPGPAEGEAAQRQPEAARADSQG